MAKKPQTRSKAKRPSVEVWAATVKRLKESIIEQQIKMHRLATELAQSAQLTGQADAIVEIARDKMEAFTDAEIRKAETAYNKAVRLSNTLSNKFEEGQYRYQQAAQKLATQYNKLYLAEQKLAKFFR